MAEATTLAKPQIAAAANSRPRPFQWNLLAWAALVGVLTGLAIVAFHLLLAFINNFLYGPFVEGLLEIARSPSGAALEPPPIDLPPLDPDSGTPLKALLQLGLGGIGFLRGIEPAPAPVITPVDEIGRAHV